jgi:hypothetical protein
MTWPKETIDGHRAAGREGHAEVQRPAVVGHDALAADRLG